MGQELQAGLGVRAMWVCRVRACWVEEVDQAVCLRNIQNPPRLEQELGGWEGGQGRVAGCQSMQEFRAALRALTLP